MRRKWKQEQVWTFLSASYPSYHIHTFTSSITSLFLYFTHRHYFQTQKNEKIRIPTRQVFSFPSSFFLFFFLFFFFSFLAFSLSSCLCSSSHNISNLEKPCLSSTYSYRTIVVYHYYHTGKGHGIFISLVRLQLTPFLPPSKGTSHTALGIDHVYLIC